MTKKELLEMWENNEDLQMLAYARYHTHLWEWVDHLDDDANVDDTAKELGLSDGDYQAFKEENES